MLLPESVLLLQELLLLQVVVLLLLEKPLLLYKLLVQLPHLSSLDGNHYGNWVARRRQRIWLLPWGCS